MTYTITIQNADTSIISALKSVLKLSPKVHFSVKKEKDDGFFSEANIRHLEEHAQLYREGKAKLITKTFEELGINV